VIWPDYGEDRRNWYPATTDNAAANPKYMEIAQQFLPLIWPPLAVVAIALLLAWISKWVARRAKDGTSNMLYQLFNWLNASAVVIAIVVLLPLDEKTQGQILSLLGLVLTAVIALSSTTFVANAMAGIMLQATQPFRPGDYIRVNDQFGRVTKRSLTSTRIQTEWRDMTNLPNMLLVNSPVTVLHRDGTIIYAEVSIGYDVTYTRVEELMLEAGADAGLEESFVLVHELLDHAVVYRICGFLTSMNNLLSSRSNLRKAVLTRMHGSGIEIVSPAFMNQRALDPSKKVIPAVPVAMDTNGPRTSSQAPEEKIFDKALEAADLEELKLKLEETREAIKREQAQLKDVGAGKKEALKSQIETLERREKSYAHLIEQRSEKK
jgi:small-conductance mechanosensitive channel